MASLARCAMGSCWWRELRSQTDFGFFVCMAFSSPFFIYANSFASLVYVRFLRHGCQGGFCGWEWVGHRCLKIVPEKRET